MDYQDILSGVDAALKQYPWVDQNNLGVTGGSYGYMTNWIVSHTNRFKAAVTLRSISNFIETMGRATDPTATKIISGASSSTISISTGTLHR
jgi:dipeptidyl aminopeptidase/acylaminoacyl peptidase